MSKPLSQIQKEVHELAVSKGWWDNVDLADPRDLSAQLMNAVSELAEAQEDVRNLGVDGLRFRRDRGLKPEGAAVEVVDCIIRCLDTLAGYGYDAETLIAEKHEYNKIRPYRHGGKVL